MFNRLALRVYVPGQVAVHPASQLRAIRRVHGDPDHSLDWVAAKGLQEFGNFPGLAIRCSHRAPARLVSDGHLLISTLDPFSGDRFSLRHKCH